MLKNVGLASAMTDALIARGVPDPQAHLAAEMGVLAFKRGFAEWSEGDRTPGDDLRAVHARGARGDSSAPAPRWGDESNPVVTPSPDVGMTRVQNSWPGLSRTHGWWWTEDLLPAQLRSLDQRGDGDRPPFGARLAQVAAGGAEEVLHAARRADGEQVHLG